MGCVNLMICGGLWVWIFCISFLGELVYELVVFVCYGNVLMVWLIQIGVDLGVVFYGMEMLGVLCIEKGYVVGNELNGQIMVQMLGMGCMVSIVKDSIGVVLLCCDGMVVDCCVLVGLQLVDLVDLVVVGLYLFIQGLLQNIVSDQGWIILVCFLFYIGLVIGLGYLENGVVWMDEIIIVVNLL